VEDDRLQGIRRKLLDDGLSKEVYDIMLSKFKVPSSKKGTLRAYQLVWNSFGTYCKKKGRNKEEVDPTRRARQGPRSMQRLQH
jgi:hypothetical protein